MFSWSRRVLISPPSLEYCKSTSVPFLIPVIRSSYLAFHVTLAFLLACILRVELSPGLRRFLQVKALYLLFDPTYLPPHLADAKVITNLRIVAPAFSDLFVDRVHLRSNGLEVRLLF